MAMRYLQDVVTLVLDRDKCIGCGLCETVCPHGVFAVADGKARIVDRDACMECGACALNCPVDAIDVRSGTGCAKLVITAAIRGTDPKDGCCGGSDCCN